jgi:prefoldin subunit 5
MSRARSLAGRALGRAARPALTAPDSPVQVLSQRVEAIERSLEDLWRISEEMRAAIDGMRQSVEESLPDVVEDVDKRIAHHDEARAAEIQGLEVMRRRLQELEAAVRAVSPR